MCCPASCSVNFLGYVGQISAQYRQHLCTDPFVSYHTLADAYFGFCSTKQQVASLFTCPPHAHHTMLLTTLAYQEFPTAHRCPVCQDNPQLLVADGTRLSTHHRYINPGCFGTHEVGSLLNHVYILVSLPSIPPVPLLSSRR